MTRILFRALLAALFSVSLLSTSANAQSNLLSNPDFETGDFTDWDISGSADILPVSMTRFSSEFGNFTPLLGLNFDIGAGSLTQSFIVPNTNALHFGSYIRLATVGSPVGTNNFDQAQVSLEIPSANLFKAVNVNVNTLSETFGPNLDREEDFYRTPWILFEGIVDVSGLAGQTALFNISLQNISPPSTGLIVDNAFVQAVPEPSNIVVLIVIGFGGLVRSKIASRNRV